MAYGVVTPNVPYANDISIGEGVIWIHYGELDEAEFTQTMGGVEYVEDCVYIDPAVDGVRGSYKGHKRYNTRTARFNVNMGKVTYDNLFVGMPYTQTDMGTYYSTRLTYDVSASDVIDNLTFVSKVHAGQVYTVQITNLINDGNIEMEFKEKAEVMCKMQYTGFATAAAPTTIPSKYTKFDVIS